MEPTTSTYAFGPFNLESEISLPELPASMAQGLRVTITLGRVPQRLECPTFETATCSASRHELLLKIPDVASYYIRDGSTVFVQPEPKSDDLDIKGYLLGNIFAVLCHQRRLLPLHASAVRMGKGAVAFLGDSGAGKSTLAAYLASRGFPLVADDICLLDPDAPPDQRVIPVAPWLKLWSTSLHALGQGDAGLSRTFQDEDKYRVPTSGFPSVEGGRLPLTAIVILRKSADSSGKIVLSSLSPAQSIMEAMRFTYQQYLLKWLGLQEEHFSRCGLAIASARGFSCDRPWGFSELENIAECLRAEFAESS